VHSGSTFQKNSRHPGSYGRGDFVVDGVQQAGEFIGADRFVRLAAEDHHLVFHGDTGNVTHVDHGQIHADPADDRRLLSADQHMPPVGQPPVESVGVTHGHCRDDGRRWSRVRHAVADGEAGGNLFQMDDPGFECHDGDEIDSAFVDLVGRVQPVKGHAGPDHVQVRVGHVDDGAAVGGVP